MIELNKKYKTRDGRKIELIHIADPEIIGKFCVIGLLYNNYTKKCSLETWKSNGSYSFEDGCISLTDMIEVEK